MGKPFTTIEVMNCRADARPLGCQLVTGRQFVILHANSGR
jgi:hypothetical protein